MAKPKLALIPAAQGSKLYSVLPSSGVGDFQFNRSGSATRINSQGLIETVASGVSRLNYPMIDGVVKGCPHHILEPQRTNYVTYSNGFTDSSWLPTGATVVSGVISPDGTSNAFTLSNTASSGIIQKAVSLTGLRVVSIFAKKGTHRYLRIGAYGGTNSYANFDLENGVVADGVNANIEYYGNGWYRCICHSADGTTGGVQIFPSNNTIGAATTNGSIQIYGVQLEQGSYPTSYIPTTTSAVTRSAETANGSGDANTFNDSEGVLMVEVSSLSELDVTARYIQISDGTSTPNGIQLRYYTTTNLLQVLYYTNSAYQAVLSYTLPNSSENNKIAFKYKENDFALWVNGLEVGTDTNGLVGATLSQLKFDYNNFSDFYGNTKQIQYFDTTLTDSELEQLTSWVSFQEMAEGQLYTIE